jgi:hypothetical protein
MMRRPKRDRPPSNRGPWPPNSDPDDPSRVPLRRKPSDDAGEVAIPLPDLSEES